VRDTLEKIERFIDHHHLLTLATQGEALWCCSLFYAYDPEEVAFIVASDPQTEHMGNVADHPDVAGTVALETKTVGKIQGIQFAGEMSRSVDRRERELYLQAYPYARIMDPILWRIRIHRCKMTDNTLGFGKKIMWRREFSD
jgi:hypothetical protein